MKSLCVGLFLLVAWNAGYWLLAALCLAGLALMGLGNFETRGGNINSRGKIVLGRDLGVGALIVALLKAAFVLVAWLSLTHVFPELHRAVKDALDWLGSL